MSSASLAGINVDIPPIWCPIESAVHPQVARINARITPWFSSFDLDALTMKRIGPTHSGEWVCRVAPDGEEEHLQIFADWVCWAFLFDDFYSDGGPLMNRPDLYNPMISMMLGNLTHPERPVFDGNPFTEPLCMLRRRLQRVVSPAQLERWVHCHYIWLLGSACSVSDRLGARVRSLDEHMFIGALDRGEDLTTLFIELCERTELSAAERNLPQVRAITGATNVLVTGYNDVASFRREVLQDSPESNLVRVLQNERKCSPQDAMTEAITLLDCVMHLFVTLREQIEPTASTQLVRYMAQLAHKIRGNIDWQRTVPRYSNDMRLELADPSGETRESPARPPAGSQFEFTDHPSHSGLIPVAPSVSWWWEVAARL
ncbi:terpene synthase family protein [Saccharopolyspora elongata]|uniref:Terpene synthase n=1 Tax=Saccharopolyspora elongata TaxID=2530387 RepID=A0A4V2YK42_9PSEU|nr:hypothetical protein [Saccharopolyspora elongata]TDD40917.1 hypothetical protein E1288_34285 [Saccharopolyspora elongata]